MIGQDFTPKELIGKPMKFLGLLFGSWALMVINWKLFWIVDDFAYLDVYEFGVRENILICVFALTIFQLWAIYKYILKK